MPNGWASPRGSLVLGRWGRARLVAGRLLAGKDEFVEAEELLEGGLRAALHLGVGAEEDGAGLMQEDDAVGELLGQAHIVGDHDRSQLQLKL